jgi:DNA-binding NarL/FixJ family response regulator
MIPGLDDAPPMQAQSKIAVMIVCNHPIMRHGLRLQVQHEADMFVVCEACNLPQILRDFHRCRPDVVMIDLQSPRGADLRAVTSIRGLSPGTPLVVLADYPGEVEASHFTGQGATVVVSKILASEQIIRAIRKAISDTGDSGGSDCA